VPAEGEPGSGRLAWRPEVVTRTACVPCGRARQIGVRPAPPRHVPRKAVCARRRTVARTACEPRANHVRTTCEPRAPNRRASGAGGMWLPRCGDCGKQRDSERGARNPVRGIQQYDLRALQCDTLNPRCRLRLANPHSSASRRDLCSTSLPISGRG
jgi:hypothetical protein